MTYQKKHPFINYVPQQSAEIAAAIKKDHPFHCEVYGFKVRVCKLESCRFFQKCSIDR